jgi:hypothetical protein
LAHYPLLVVLVVQLLLLDLVLQLVVLVVMRWQLLLVT